MKTELRRYTDPIRFHARVAAHLSRHEAENNLLLGILANVMAGEYSEVTPYMAVVERDEDIDQVLLRTPPHPVLISFQEHVPSGGTVCLAVNDLYHASGDDLSGMTADKQVVKAYVDTWQDVTGKQGRHKVAMRIYKLTQVKPVTSIPGVLRRMTEADRELVVEWILGFYRDTHHEGKERDKAHTTVDRYLRADPAQGGLMLWDIEGAPVSMAGYSGPTPNGIRINAVYTPPVLRRRGYACACVGALSRHLLDRGYAFCFLFTDLSNPTSNHIYQEIGYRPVSDVDSYAFN